MLTNKRILITGGLGFIGINATSFFAKQNEVCVIDNCSRIGVKHNIEKLNSLGVNYYDINIANYNDLRKAYDVVKPDVIFHLAAQVAVTLSIQDPKEDFESNLLGTFNLLELVRLDDNKPIVLYASTNKVYGQNIDDSSILDGKRNSTDTKGVSEACQLSFGTPYGCSKGAADQYVIDYAKTYQIPTITFRQSCIYGPHQYGLEDQGWVAWFGICASLDLDLTIYGDGTQIRDVLYIDDLIELYEKAILDIDKISGKAFNVGGGPENTLSLNQLIDLLEEKFERKITKNYSDWRLGDQKVYISDIENIESAIGWKPKVDVKAGIEKLSAWIEKNKKQIQNVHSENQKRNNVYDVSIVIPARNEEESLGATLSDIDTFIRHSKLTIEVILVDDKSTDRTVSIAKQYTFVRVVINEKSLGKGAALRTGFEIAQGNFFVMMDADFSHDVNDLSEILEVARKTNGLVIASRLTGGSEEYTRVRAFGNIFLTWLFGFVHGRYLSDALNGYKVFHRDIFTSYEYTSNAFEIEIELLANALRLDRQISEIPSRERIRLGGVAKSSVVRHGTRFAWRILREKMRRPERIV